MRRMGKRMVSVIAMAMVLVFSVSCMIPQTAMVVEAATVKLSKTSAVMYPTETLQLKVQGTKKTVTWSSSKKSVATVSSKGKISAKTPGSAVISAKVGGKSYKCKLTVRKPALCTKGDNCEREQILLNVGNSYTLKLRGTKAKVTWKTSNKKVATVTNGKVKAVGEGECAITATDTKSKKKYICNVQVTNWLHAEVSSLNMKVGESRTIRIDYDMTWGDVPYAAYYNEDVSKGKELLDGEWGEWKPNDKSDYDGPGYWTLKVTAKKPGKTVLRITVSAVLDSDDYLWYEKAGEEADFWYYAEDQEYIEIPITVTK